MPLYTDENGKTSVMINGATVVWDAITQPEINDSGKTKYALKVVVPANSPDVPLLQQMADKCLQESPFRGVLPQGGRMPIGVATAAEFNGLFAGWHVINAGTYRSPVVYDENGQQLEPMQYGGAIYGGQQVNILVHCYDYDNKSKGVAAGLDGFSIIASAQGQRHSFGGGGINTSNAFAGGGGQPQSQPQQQQGGYQQQPQQSTDFLPKGPGGPAGPAGPAADPKYVTADGQWTRAQLLSAGFDDAYVNALPVAQ